MIASTGTTNECDLQKLRNKRKDQNKRDEHDCGNDSSDALSELSVSDGLTERTTVRALSQLTELGK